MSEATELAPIVGGLVSTICVLGLVIKEIVINKKTGSNQTSTPPVSSNGKDKMSVHECMEVRKECNIEFNKISKFIGETSSDIKTIFKKQESMERKQDSMDTKLDQILNNKKGGN